VRVSLRRQVAAINKLSKRGMHFWDYGNSFMLEARRAEADIQNAKGDFRYPSYVQDIMGDIFSLGFGPFRWVCTSGEHQDLLRTDAIAQKILQDQLSDPNSSPASKQQYQDNLTWIIQADSHKLVVGSQARILYSDSLGRAKIAQAFNRAIASGELHAAVVLSRDHHDVSGTDSPYRETSNITDGSSFCADMAVQNFVGDGFRGATWISLHNGGGTGWGEAINGGFGMVLDGSADAERRAVGMLFWDVNNGIARRAWARNQNAETTIRAAMKAEPRLRVTLPHHADDVVVERAIQKARL